MVNEVNNNWPLVPVYTPDVTILRKDSAAKFSSERRKDSIAFENKVRHKSVYFWEKGVFIDIYT
ncbi:MAG: hypothetical protein KKD92_06140 [Proteobacteria bacterium]|nr:hypothetical protein [Pseudomonadota bacterium]